MLTGTSVPVCVADDADKTEEEIRCYLHFYLQLPNYQPFFAETGFADEVELARRAVDAGDGERPRADHQHGNERTAPGVRWERCGTAERGVEWRGA